MTSFADLFGKAPIVAADAPGRVNLIGEHTDYNGGFVLPTAIPQRTRVELAQRQDTRVRVLSATAGGGIQEYLLGQESPGKSWLDFIQGTTRLLMGDGHKLGGFDALITSDVPLGSGLSSSASLDVALLRALRTAFGLPLTDLQIARLGQRIENEFVGAQVGIMDPMACSLADLGTALFLDARSLEFERVPLPRHSELVVIHSGMAHDHAAGDYNTRRSECERAASLLGVGQLRDLSMTDLPRITSLPEPVSRRARHIVTENQRVLDAVQAMRTNDLPRLGELFHASHISQRDDFQVSIPAIDLLVELAEQCPETYGARLTGGGFGGSIVALVQEGKGKGVAKQVVDRYHKQTGREAVGLVP